MDFSRNWLFIPPALQAQLGSIKILVAGLGIGSVFSEIAVRTGVRNLTIADGDTVDASNLNRQNYTAADMAQLKAHACAERLRAISPDLNLQVIPKFLQGQLLRDLIQEHDVVINTIDFDAPEFALVTEYCQQYQKIEFFPINLGFGATLTVLDSQSPSWQEVFPPVAQESLKTQILSHIIQAPEIEPYLEKAARRYFNPDAQNPAFDPQLCISSHMVASMMMSLIIKILAQEDIERFPYFYYQDAYAPVLLHGNKASSLQTSA